MNKTDRLLNKDKLKIIAEQLRKPEGDLAIDVAKKMNSGNRLINLSTIEALEVKPHDRLLEIGMGNGFFVKDIFALNNSLHYCGCDYAEIMVDESLKNNEQLVKVGQAEFHVASADALPFADHIFDKVFSVNTVYFWEDPEKVLAEIHRVLSQQGKLVLALRPKASMEKYPFVKYGFDTFTKNDLTGLLSENRFSVMNYWEKEEPEQDIAGKKMKGETLIVSAKKQP